LATKLRWRPVGIVSSGLGVLQVLIALFRWVPDTPVWLSAKGRYEEARLVESRLWSSKDDLSSGHVRSRPDTPGGGRGTSASRTASIAPSGAAEAQRPLLSSSRTSSRILSDDEDDGSDTEVGERNSPRGLPLPGTSEVPPNEPIGIYELLFRRKELRRAIAIVALAMITQQGSGINAGERQLESRMTRRL
jgi:hypothetical protein